MPDYVVELVSDALNQRRRFNGATILALGVAYKGGVSDTRESPELEVLANSSTELRRSRYSCDSHRPDLEASVRVETCPPESKREKSPGSRGRTMARASARLLLVTATVFFASTVQNPALAQTPLFTAPRDFGVGFNPASVAVGDFNGDGKRDLAVANYNSSTVSVLLGNGNGTFQPAVTLAVGANPLAVAVGDFNRDGKLDLVVANAGAVTVSVLRGDGGGNFQAAQNFATGIRPWSVAVADFNGDGRPDLAVANFGSTNVSVLLNNGAGGFQAAVTLEAGVAPDGIAAGGINGDGRPGLAPANAGRNSLSALFGNGPGTFKGGRTVRASSRPWGGGPAGNGPVAVAVADFDGDGNLDLAVANYGSGCAGYMCDTTSRFVSILWGDGRGNFSAPQPLLVGIGPNSVAVEDFNGDGRPDLAVANYGSTHNAGGTCAVGTSCPFGDGNTVSVLLNSGNRTFLPAVTYSAGPGSAFVAVGDFNGDGKKDLVVANYGCTGCRSSVSVLRGNGNGTFQNALNFLVDDGAWSVAVADFNRDGIQDLAVATYLGPTVSILLGNGDGTFQPKPSLSPNSGRPASVVAGDFNGDGVTDLAVANYRSTTVSVFVGNGDGTFQPALDFGAGNGPFALAMADVNGDLVQDLITANYDSTNISVLLGTTRAAAVTLVSLAVSPPSVIGGNSATGTVTLSGPAPAGGAQVTLSSNSSAATVPASVTVPAGATSATFTLTTSAVTASTSATISAVYSGVTRTATLTVNPAAGLSSLALSPTTVTGGSNSTGTATLDGPAPAGGAQRTEADTTTPAAPWTVSLPLPAGRNK